MRIWIGALSLALAVLGGVIAGPSSRAMADEKYIISAENWGHFQTYLSKIRNGLRPGAYAITKDGYSSYYYTCSQTNCMPGLTYSQDALNACEREYNTECVVFAVRDDIRVDYEIASRETSSVAPSLSPAPPVTKIKVSAEVKAEIDQYLRNAQRAGRVWALAIANDGSQVGVASCQSTGGGGYFGGGGAGCNLVSGGPQDEASREALMRCGGPTACVLLYQGSTKSANIDVYGPDELGAVTAPAQPPEPSTAAVSPAPSAPESAPTLSAAPAPELSSPPPATRIVVSAVVKAEIDSYLGNAQRAGRASALAIAQDGSEVAAANCPTSGTYSGGRACEPIKGTPQELASREAVMRCGGPAACIVLYEGAQPTGKIEIVTQ